MIRSLCMCAAYTLARQKFEVRNSDATIQRFYDREMAKAETPVRREEVEGIASRMRTIEIILEQHTNRDGKVLVLDQSFNARYDLCC